jgi:HK97 family phage major capsid protein/HK97 family phage prohead protease
MNPEDLAAVPPARLPFPVTRAVATKVETRVEGDGMPTMVGHFSTSNRWYEVESWIEGRFMERLTPGAHRKTIRESRDSMKVLYDHGGDPQIGNKILGPIDVLREDDVGPYFEVPLFDTSYNRDLRPGLEAGVYGTSFRFTVEKDMWDYEPERSDHNPEGIPERTISEVRDYEFGPVTFPANPTADIGVRSTTDTFYQRSRDPEAFESLLRTAQQARTPKRSDGGTVQPSIAYTVGENGIEQYMTGTGISIPIKRVTISTPATAGAAARSDEPPAGTPEEPPEPDTPRPPDPPPDEPATEPDDPPDGGSSDSRSATVELTTIEEKRARVSELDEAIARQAVAFPGVMPDDEQARYDADLEERKSLRADVAAWDSRQADLVDRSKQPKNTEPGEDRGATYRPPEFNVKREVRRDIYAINPSEFRTSEERDTAWRDDAMRIAEIATFPHPDTDVERSKDKIANLLDYNDSPDKELARRIKATGSPVYRRAFEKILRGHKDYLTPEEQRGTALAVGVDGTGGFAVPFAFDPTVIAIGVNNGAVNFYRRVCRVVNIVGTDTWNALTATVVVATRTTEAAPAIEQGPTFAQPQYIVKRVQAQITYSIEMGQDRPDLSSEMAKLIQEAKDNEEETQFAIGVGTTVFPLGIGPVSGTSGAYTAVAGAGSGVLAEGDFTATEAALPVRHRFNAVWGMNRVNIRKAQSLETTGGKLFGGSQYPAVGNPAVDSAGNTGLRLLGYPVNESPSLPVATTTTITAAVLFNPDSYVIVDRVGMSIQLIPFIFGASQGNLVTGQQAIYAMWRNDARPINVDAGRVLRFL